MLRAARPQDAESIATVLIESRRVFLPFAPSPHPEDAMRRWVSTTLLSTCRVMVWEEGHQVVAVLAVSEGGDGSWIDQLYVLPGWNGQGIGSKLLAHAHQTLARPIRLYTFQQNTGARRFYERHGYAPVAFTDGQGNEEQCPDVLYVNSTHAESQPEPQARESARIAILGNSGSGKSTLAAWLAQSAGLALLDLDTVAWDPHAPALARAEGLAEADVTRFCLAHPAWVVEGCYGNLIEASLRFDPLLVFLNPGLEACTTNCRRRPWEPHKYPSPAEQDANLQSLLSWVSAYDSRQGPTSLASHRAVFDGYAGRKVEFRHVPQLNPPEAALLALLR